MHLSSIVGALLLGASTVIGAPASYDSTTLERSLETTPNTPEVLTKRATSAGCGKTPTLTSGTKSINVNGKTRQYIIRVPNNYDKSKPYKLIFAFHWRGGSMTDVAGGGSDGAAWAYYGQQKKAGETAILVAPNGLNGGWANSGDEDLAFVDAMRKAIEADLCVDETQRFSTGFSYGGGMSYSLACSRGKEFRAVAVISGGQLSGCSGGNDPVAYLGIHGVGDSTLNISQGRSLRDRFVKNNGCAAQSPKEPAGGSRSHVKTQYSGCKSGYPVTWIAFDGGHAPAPVDNGNDSGAKSYVPDEIWSFFNQFSS
ncbi:alpha/beta-hydrolase [Phaeosphaeriaceae sp. SRC1lsM3a]|nr:alpha/beta-hydrolase [Stagonospora sp. SRC1lsM3a]